MFLQKICFQQLKEFKIKEKQKKTVAKNGGAPQGRCVLYIINVCRAAGAASPSKIFALCFTTFTSKMMLLHSFLKVFTVFDAFTKFFEGFYGF